MNETEFYVYEHEMTLEEVVEALKKYECQYGMTSKEFYEKWKRGETDLVAESVEWISFVEAYHVLNGKASDKRIA